MRLQISVLQQAIPKEGECFMQVTLTPQQRTGLGFLERLDREVSLTSQPEFEEHRAMTAQPFMACRLAIFGGNTHWPENPRTKRALEQQIEARRREIAAWEDALSSHAGHPRLRLYEDAENWRLSFRCRCGLFGALELGVSLRRLRFSPDARAVIASVPKIRQRFHTGQTAALKLERSANRRARALLHQLLTREQRWSLRARRAFLVTGRDGRTYEVVQGANVRLLVEGRPQTTYCIHPRERLPAYDVMLAQKLLIESNTERFLALANVHPFV